MADAPPRPAATSTDETTAHPSATAPSTARGQATRRAIVDGARRVFEAKGFVDARITDIARESDVATGSFYTYFPTKESVLAAVFAELQEEMLHPQLSRDGERHERVADVIAASHRAYLETYRDHAQLMALREQVAAVDGVFREARRERSAEFVRRNARMITRLQAAGLADARLAPELAASSLSGMVARAAYTAFVLGEDTPMDELVEILTILWMNALGIPEDAPALSGPDASTPTRSDA